MQYLIKICQGVLAALPLLLLIFGVLLYLSGLYLVTDPKIQAMVFSIASAVLAGGVFAALLKSFQFIGVFRDAIADVMYRDTKFLARLDLPAMMLSIISSMLEQRFPELTRKMSTAVFNNYLTFAKDGYYTDMHRRITVLNYEPAKDLITFQEEFRLTIHSHPDQEIPYNFELTGPLADSADEIPCDVTGLGVNNDPHLDKVRKEKRANGEYFLGYAIKLTGKSKYDVTRTMLRRHVLSADPFVKAVSTRFLDGAELIVENRVSDKIGVHLMVIGLGESALVPDKAMTGDISRWQIEGLIFPRQGYILVFTKKP